MGQSVHFGVQQFGCDKAGRPTVGRLTRCASAEEARRLAERCVSNGRAAGAAAFSCRVEDGSDLVEPITIAAFGTVPSEAQDAVPY